MKIGDILPAALWFNEDNPQERLDAERGIRESMEMIAEYDGIEFGPITWEVVDPMSPRVPTPPDNFQGNIKCLIGYVVITKINAEDGEFTDDIELQDLINLRQVTKKAVLDVNGMYLTDEEADEIINQYGIEVVHEETIH